MTLNENINEALKPINEKMYEHGSSDKDVEIYGNGFRSGAMWAYTQRLKEWEKSVLIDLDNISYNELQNHINQYKEEHRILNINDITVNDMYDCFYEFVFNFLKKAMQQ